MMRKWYLESGTSDDIVVSTRIRLARNLMDLPFPRKMTPEQKKALNDSVYGVLQNIHLGDNALHFIDPSQVDDYQLVSWVENHIISPDFAQCSRKETTGLILSEDESVSIMLGEEDCIRIQILKNGLELGQALELANRLDDILDASLSYAFDEKFGYLTSCPTNLGTGLRASVMLHLPAMEKIGMMPSLMNTISKLGLTIRGSFGEGSQARGSLYQISNQITLGISDENAVNNLSSIVGQIISQESAARQRIAADETAFQDKIMRVYGLLRYALLISEEEAGEWLSLLRLGVSMGYLKDVSVAQLNEISAHSGRASLCLTAAEANRGEGQGLSAREQDALRAKMIQSVLDSCARK